MDETVANLKSGPKVFMSRLRSIIDEKGKFDNENFDTWINLSFKPIPNFVRNKKSASGTKIVVRFDGIYNMRLLPSNSPLPKAIISKINNLFLLYKNNILIKNYNYADKVIYQSEYSKFLIEEFLFKRNNIERKESTIIKNGVDLKRFKPKERIKQNDELNILVSHRMVPPKRVHLIPEISRELNYMGINHKIHVVGSGVKNPWDKFIDTEQRIQNNILKTNTQSNFIFHGYVDPDELPQFYSECDLMLNLSYADPCPNVVVEAMACGLPVIAPNSGGIRELVPSKELLVNEFDNINPKWVSWNYNDLPIIGPKLYADKIQNVMANLRLYKELTIKNVIEEHDIVEVTQKYMTFVEGD